MTFSLEIGANDFEQLLRGFGIQGFRILLGIDEMRMNVPFDDFSHQSRERTANPCDEVHDLAAHSVAVQRPFNTFNLAFDPTHARQKFLFVANCMGHAASIV